MLYTVAGINHFWHPIFYKEIVPSYFPYPLFIVYASGVLEILLGVLLIFYNTRKLTCIAIAIMLVLFLPVHFYMLQQAHQNPHYQVSETKAWIRLLLQPILIAWVWWQKINSTR